MNNLKSLEVTMIELDQERTFETIDATDYNDCLETIEAHSSYEGNFEEYYFSTETHTITLDHENKKVIVTED